jgi:hypothetical protein
VDQVSPWWTLLALLAVLVLVWWASGLLVSIEYESLARLKP